MQFGSRFLCCLIFGLSMPAWAGPLAQFRTVLGDIDVELYEQDKPVTVQNFIRYIQSGTYTNDMIIHRWEPGFVIQGGGYYTENRHTTNAVIASITPFPAITNEYSVGRIYSNTYGTLAMARISGETNSADSQWFFNLTNNASLDQVDGGFTVFGHAVGGTNVLNRFNLVSTNNGIWRINIGDPLTAIPVLSANPTYEDLVYVDVTLLNVHVAQNPSGERAISWDSVSNRVNHVQFTTQFPPVWTALIDTNGNGQTMTVSDGQTTNRFRFYRVTVDY
jgi:cyclophilin family peptidyl-prolyl cis-trans isomerase